MQDLLENTAVSGSNEGIIRIWEISSEKFVRWLFHPKLLNLLLQEAWLLRVWGGECIETDQGGGKKLRVKQSWNFRNWCWAVMTMGNLLFGRWEVQMKRWWIEIVQIKIPVTVFSSGFTVISVTRSSRHSLVPWHGQVATIKPTNMQNNSSTFAVTTWWPARKTKQYVCINLPAFYTLPLFFSTGNDKIMMMMTMKMTEMMWIISITSLTLNHFHVQCINEDLA